MNLHHPINQLSAFCQQEFQPGRLLLSLMAGLTNGILLTIFLISFASLIFSGELSRYVSAGTGLLLMSGLVINFVVALMSSLPGIVAIPHQVPLAILSVVAQQISLSMVGASTPEKFLTLITIMVLSSLLSGLIFLLLGGFKLGNLIRFIPYPVIGGFLAGTGWLLLRGGIRMMSDLSLSFSNLPALLTGNLLFQWLPGLIFAIVSLSLVRRYKHFSLTPGLIAGANLLFYWVLLVTGTSFSQAQAQGFLLKLATTERLWQPLSFSDLMAANWQTIASFSGQLSSILLLSVIGLLLNISGIELATGKDIHFNRELKISGIANLVSCVSGGGSVSYPSFSYSLRGYMMGAPSRLVGLLVGLTCAIVLFQGASLLSFIPKFVLGGLLVWTGLDSLIEWVWDSWFKLPKVDYFSIILILLVIISVGFLEGVGVGLVITIISFVVKYSTINVTKSVQTGATRRSNVQRSLWLGKVLDENGDRIYILELQSFLFFGTANKLLEQIRERINQGEQQPLSIVVLDFRSVDGIDSSAVYSFVKIRQIAHKSKVSLVFTDMPPSVEKLLQRGGALAKETASEQIFDDLDRGLEWSEDYILDKLLIEHNNVFPLTAQLEQVFASTEQAIQFKQYLELLLLSENQFVFRQGDSSDGLYFLEMGQVSVLLKFPVAGSKRLRTFTSGTIFGEMGLYGKTQRSASVIVDRPCRLYYLSNRAFEQIETDDPLLAANFHKYIVNLMSERLKHRENELLEILGYRL